MRRERGFALPAQVWMGLGALALIAAGFLAFTLWLSGVKSEAYDRGAADKKAEWDAQKLKDAELEQRKEASIAQALLKQEEGRLLAEQEAQRNEDKWKEAKRAADRNRQSLASCQAAPRGPAAEGPGAVVEARARGGEPPAQPEAPRPAGGSGIALHWRFVGLHDGAFTGLRGEPLFPAAAQLAADPARADAASPYGLGELLDVNAENARKLSACRRAVADIRAKVSAAAAAWDLENAR